MKLIEKNTFGDDTFYILEMEDQDKEAISEHIGDVNGISCIMVYPPLMTRLWHIQESGIFGLRSGLKILIRRFASADSQSRPGFIREHMPKPTT